MAGKSSMGKNRPTRRRKPQAPEPEPVAPEPKSEVVVHRAAPPAPPAAPLLAELIDTLRAVAGRMIDIADAAAEAVTRRLKSRT
jgi:hypothetical protein